MFVCMGMLVRKNVRLNSSSCVSFVSSFFCFSFNFFIRSYFSQHVCTMSVHFKHPIFLYWCFMLSDLHTYTSHYAPLRSGSIRRLVLLSSQVTIHRQRNVLQVWRVVLQGPALSASNSMAVAGAQWGRSASLRIQSQLGNRESSLSESLRSAKVGWSFRRSPERSPRGMSFPKAWCNARVLKVRLWEAPK